MAAPASPTSLKRDVPGDLVWLKLRSAQVFWPACVYETYSQAVSNSHDLSSVRDARPITGGDECIVYFFGVGPQACLARTSAGVTPTLQLCVARDDDITSLPFTGHDHEFAQICRDYHISSESVSRAERNACFQRACAEARRYKATVHSAHDASTLFINLLVSAKDDARVTKSARALPATTAMATPDVSKARKTSPVASPSRASQDLAAPPSEPARPAFYSPPHAKLARALNSSTSPSKKVLSGLEHIAATIMPIMLEAGWETLTQGDGAVLYKMPGVGFFDLRPNENVFDSLAKAFTTYVRDWTLASRDDERESSKLMDALWPMVETAGWVKITASNEVWYMMPDTPFNACVPNVTIFQSKAQVLTKFLEAEGILEPPAPATPAPVASESTAMDVDDDNASSVEAEQASASDGDSSDDEDDEDEDDDAESSDDEVEVVDVVAPSKSVKASAAATKTKKSKASAAAPAPTTKAKAAAASKPKPSASAAPVAASSTSAAKKLTFGSKPIPPFKCTFGKVEAALRARGWFWKPSALGYSYFQPYCASKDKSALVAGVDYFVDSMALEEYLEVSGLYDDLREELRREHEAMYASASDDDDSDTDAPPTATATTTTSSSSTKKAPTAKPKTSSASRPTVSKAVERKSQAAPVSSSKRHDDADKENRSSNVQSRNSSRSARPLADAPLKRSKRARGVLSSTVAASSIKFGEIWAVLAEQGWHWKMGKFEYDYFKPTCRDAADGVAGVDYFVSKSLLIEYLEQSGIWDRIARQIASGDALDLASSDDEAGAKAPTASATPSPVAPRQALKRKSHGLSERKSLSSHTVGSAVRTPTMSNKALATKKARVAETFRTPTESDAADKISPETGSQKAAAAHDSSNLPRKLADCFTPSPETGKKTKTLSGPHVLFADAIQKLTLGYCAPEFQYRDDEARSILDFFQTCFTARHGASMYISGAPGCGKTALLKASAPRITELFQEANPTHDTKRLVQCHVNAMALTDAAKLYCSLASKLTHQSFDDGERAFEAIERATSAGTKRSKTMVLILDEIDTLLKKNGVEGDLCRLFELAHRPSHAFILVGIANQVDFTERHLPLLKQQLPDCAPQVVIFKPYVHQTIEQILIDRLGGKATALQMLNAHGISFLARKIASTSGDIRLALDICRRVLQHRLDAATEAGEDGAALLLTPVPLTDMLRLVKASLESKSAQVVQSLPRTLQMILFASTRLVATNDAAMGPADTSANAGTLFTNQELYMCYCDVSRDAGVFKPLTFREFKTALETLGSEGLIGAAELKKQLIKLLYAPSELLQCFRNDAYFARLV